MGLSSTRKKKGQIREGITQFQLAWWTLPIFATHRRGAAASAALRVGLKYIKPIERRETSERMRQHHHVDNSPELIRQELLSLLLFVSLLTQKPFCLLSSRYPPSSSFGTRRKPSPWNSRIHRKKRTAAVRSRDGRISVMLCDYTDGRNPLVKSTSKAKFPSVVKSRIYILFKGIFGQKGGKVVTRYPAVKGRSTAKNKMSPSRWAKSEWYVMFCVVKKNVIEHVYITVVDGLFYVCKKYRGSMVYSLAAIIYTFRNYDFACRFFQIAVGVMVYLKNKREVIAYAVYSFPGLGLWTSLVNSFVVKDLSSLRLVSKVIADGGVVDDIQVERNCVDTMSSELNCIYVSP